MHLRTKGFFTRVALVAGLALGSAQGAFAFEVADVREVELVDEFRVNALFELVEFRFAVFAALRGGVGGGLRGESCHGSRFCGQAVGMGAQIPSAAEEILGATPMEASEKDSSRRRAKAAVGLRPPFGEGRPGRMR